ncbi:MAG: ATP-binding cassette domain-containing protein [Clostridiaceae bacterium]|nr:ATP-binding cassette domain-containing protein [Clostridiaceae bacterium]
MKHAKRKFINLRATHPSLLLLYFFSVLIFSMLTLNPAYLLLSFLAALTLNIYLEGAAKLLRFFRSFIPLHLLIVLANGLFSGNGLTVLFYLGLRPVTLESIIYGFAAGMMLLTILLWFRAYQEVSSSDQLLSVGGKRFPVTSLLLGMVLRYVPDTIEHGHKVKMSQNALLGEEKMPRRESLAFYTRMSSVLMSWSMENALDTSIAMRAKGYPSDRRSTYKRDRFSVYDAGGIVFLLLMIVLQIVGFATGTHSFQYYPSLALPADLPALSWRLLTLVFYALYLFFPFYLELMEWWGRKKILRAESQFSGQSKSGLLLDRETDLRKPEVRNMNQKNNPAAGPGSQYQADHYNPAFAAELKDLSFAYPGAVSKALDELSLSFERSSLTLLTGASGSGKTTLLRMLSPVLTPAGDLSGSRIIYGKPGSAYETADKAVQIGFVQQNPDNQIILDSVWHELAFGLENQGLASQDIERRLAETSTFFGISDWMDRKVSELSGGEKQILNLASSLVMQPDLLLLDEPMAQLDPIARKRFLSILGRVNDETGTSIIISEHIIDDILPLADKVIFLEKGKVNFCGNAESYVTNLLEKDDKFQISIPLAARMAAASEVRARSSEISLPLTVREGRQYLLTRQDIPAENRNITDPATAGPNEAETVLAARDIWFRYEKDAPFVLRGASLSIKKGELHALLGGNGSGKSTLMYILSRSLPALRGKIQRAGNQQVAMLNQNPMAVFSQDTVRDELMEFHQRFAYDTTEAEKIMERLKLSHLSSRHPYDLSGGEMQKTALAKALLTKPDLLLLDEPVKGLDPVARRELAAILEELKQTGMTMLLITHDLDFIAQLADRCSMLFDGRVEGSAPTREFFVGNAYFTTTAHRLSRGIFPALVTEEDLLSCVRSMKSKEEIND